MSFSDHFSGHADEYAKYRPGYPPEVFEWIASVSPETGLAWDCGTGNGQAAVALATRFDLVVATDASAEQIAAAQPHPKVTYSTAAAEESGLPSSSVDVVVIAQALHWFDHDRFFEEVRRVVRPRGLVVALGYARPFFESEAMDAEFRNFAEIVESDWPAERHHIEERYETIDFPFERIGVPKFPMEFMWPLAGLLGYLSTWSAVKRHLKRTGVDAVEQSRAGFEAAWGDPLETKRVSWPLIVVAGSVI